MTAIRSRDLPLIQQVCSFPDHRLRDVIIAKARSSTPDIQKKLLDILLPEDAMAMKTALQIF